MSLKNMMVCLTLFSGVAAAETSANNTSNSNGNPQPRSTNKLSDTCPVGIGTLAEMQCDTGWLGAIGIGWFTVCYDPDSPALKKEGSANSSSETSKAETIKKLEEKAEEKREEFEVAKKESEKAEKDAIKAKDEAEKAREAADKGSEIADEGNREESYQQINNVSAEQVEDVKLDLEEIARQKEEEALVKEQQALEAKQEVEQKKEELQQAEVKVAEAKGEEVPKKKNMPDNPGDYERLEHLSEKLDLPQDQTANYVLLVDSYGNESAIAEDDLIAAGGGVPAVITPEDPALSDEKNAAQRKLKKDREDANNQPTKDPIYDSGEAVITVPCTTL